VRWLLPLVWACGCVGGAQTGPCAHDSLACGDGPLFVIDEACESADELHASLGQGDVEFIALLPGMEPELRRASQGAEYFSFAVRIDNPRADQLGFRVEIDLEALDDEAWNDIARRRAVYAADVVRYDGTAVEIPGIVVVPDAWGEAEDRRIRLDVTDTCGRRASVIHELDIEVEGSSSGSGSGSATSSFE
jgi:hypothetical protein